MFCFYQSILCTEKYSELERSLKTELERTICCYSMQYEDLLTKYQSLTTKMHHQQKKLEEVGVDPGSSFEHFNPSVYFLVLFFVTNTK